MTIEGIVSLVGGSFVVTVIFIGGMTFQRLKGIEGKLDEMKEKFPTIGSFAKLESQVEQLREDVKDLKHPPAVVKG